MSIKKKKRKLNGKFIALLSFSILLVLSIYKIPNFINTNKLLSLGYKEESIKAIRKKGLLNTILKNEYYSDYLNEEINDEDFNSKYLRLYLITDYLDNDYFELYEKLKDKKQYIDEELENLYSKLKYYDLRPLLIFDKLEDIDDYINDCLSHENSENHFEISGDYLHPYTNYIEVENRNDIDVYVSSKAYLGTYVPEKLSIIRSQYSIPNVQMETRALEEFYRMCEAMKKDINTSVYAISAYVSYNDQKEIYMSNPNRIKEGFIDSQTGLSVSVHNEEKAIFKETNAYKWLIDHAHEYGFILRYPSGKESLTGYKEVPNYFRYVGTSLATEIYESGLCFDEYYFYYIY